MDDLTAFMDRRDEIIRRIPNCPECFTDQIQLLGVHEAKSELRCRRCKFTFIIPYGWRNVK